MVFLEHLLLYMDQYSIQHWDNSATLFPLLVSPNSKGNAEVIGSRVHKRKDREERDHVLGT